MGGPAACCLDCCPAVGGGEEEGGRAVDEGEEGGLRVRAVKEETEGGDGEVGGGGA